MLLEEDVIHELESWPAKPCRDAGVYGRVAERCRLVEHPSDALFEAMFRAVERQLAVDDLEAKSILQGLQERSGWERACVASAKRAPNESTIWLIGWMLYRGIHKVAGVSLIPLLDEIKVRRDLPLDWRLLARDYAHNGRQKPKEFLHTEIP